MDRAAGPPARAGPDRRPRRCARRGRRRSGARPGWRALGIAGTGGRLGLHGFGAAARILAQVARWQGRSVYAFTRHGDDATQAFARSLGAVWAGGSDTMPPQPLDAAIIFATASELVPQALKSVRKGGRVVCAGIHMSDIPGFPHDVLWEERELLSVANLTRQDGLDFLRRDRAARPRGIPDCPPPVGVSGRPSCCSSPSRCARSDAARSAPAFPIAGIGQVAQVIELVLTRDALVGVDGRAVLDLLAVQRHIDSLAFAVDLPH